jgi:hypothetical protein
MLFAYLQKVRIIHRNVGCSGWQKGEGMPHTPILEAEPSWAIFGLR